ncbi:hypothetical protein O3G_MSEX009170 [Manduca sexta]|uniref:Uncharacterized protein n=1 Tax=Manduca sexta TaxID=7130 RepID=A0A922CRM9_MANSE|nr:hypothetical protein O3G_MSEX009170 [Manduca sexta]KAG6455359.1 hypothetical protein O3G_MSEX009170 [Manduca sexta]KAG6455360.1 hypothetical protein O3G_MSEX009170 [Manduca sexta]
MQAQLQNLHSRGERIWLLGDLGHPLMTCLSNPNVNAENGPQNIIPIFTTASPGI